jgi:hypothetical protein
MDQLNGQQNSAWVYQYVKNELLALPSRALGCFGLLEGVRIGRRRSLTCSRKWRRDLRVIADRGAGGCLLGL